MHDAYERVRRVASDTGLPGIEASPWYGTPGLKVKGKGFARMFDSEVLVIRCPTDEKEILLEAAPDVFFQTKHYEGYPAFLVRLANISDGELSERIVRAWRMTAPGALLKQMGREPEPI